MAICIKCRGVLNFVIQGRNMKLQADGDVTVLVSRQNRTAVYNGEFTAEERNPEIIASVVVPSDMYVSTIQELCNVPLVLELCDGRTFSTDSASNVSQDPFDTKTGLQPVDFIMDEITEMLPVAGAMSGFASGFAAAA